MLTFNLLETQRRQPPGGRAYALYGRSGQWLDRFGYKLPAFSDLVESEQARWADLERALVPQIKLSAREIAAVDHAIHYAHYYPDAGTPGHNLLLLIARLATALGLATETLS